MGIGALTLLLVVLAVVLLNKGIAQFVCPYCGGHIRRVFQRMRCDNCGRYCYLWQARRNKSI